MHLNCENACSTTQARHLAVAESALNWGSQRDTSSTDWRAPEAYDASSFAFGDYRIGVAEANGRLSDISELVHRMYSWRGYRTSSSGPVVRRQDQVTLAAIVGDHLFGTLSVTLDSPGGLAADALYTEEINALRKVDGRLCEFTQLAIEPRFNSKDFFARLIHVAFVYAHLIHHASDMVIEVNPRHVGFYRRMLGFNQAGPERLCERVLAPAVLMHIDLAHMGQQIACHGGGNHPNNGRSLYPYFFSPAEQSALFQRMSRGVERPDLLPSPTLMLPAIRNATHGSKSASGGFARSYTN